MAKKKVTKSAKKPSVKKSAAKKGAVKKAPAAPARLSKNVTKKVAAKAGASSKPANKRAAPAVKSAKPPAAAAAPKVTAPERTVSLGRPLVTQEEKLYMLFHDDYQARQVFEFLRVNTVKELEQFSQQQIIHMMSKPLRMTLDRIRQRLATFKRSLRDDEQYAKEYLKSTPAGPSATGGV